MLYLNNGKKLPPFTLGSNPAQNKNVTADFTTLALNCHV